MKNKTKLINNIQIFLESKNGLKKSWIRSIIVGLLSLIIASIIIGLISDYGPGGLHFNSTISLSENLSINIYQSNIAKNLSIAVFVITLFPLVCLFSSWIIGINQTSKSKYFHLFMWFFMFVSILIAIIALVFFIRACVFNLNSYFV